MKIIIILSLIIISSQFSALHSTLWEVKQDGTGDFNTIQNAVNSAVDGDSILVHPGRYLETVNYLEKSLSIFSLAITTGDNSYVKQTVIDGNWDGTVVTIRDCDDAYLGGFTLTRGSGSMHSRGNWYAAGGLLVMDSKALIEDCFIYGNNTQAAGGVSLRTSRVTLRGNTIMENSADHLAGGLSLLYGDEDNYYIFCKDKRNNIYKNSATRGSDIAVSGDYFLEIPLGKATVLHQDPYFYLSSGGSGELKISAEKAAVEQVASDLYVATWGSDDNSGLTPDDPLQRIFHALIKVEADSLNPRTIYIEEGTYSYSRTEELLPLQFRPYVTLTSLKENTRWTIDAEGRSQYGKSIENIGDVTIRNAVFKRGTLNICNFVVRTNGHTATLENIDIIESIPYNNLDCARVGVFFRNRNLIMSNVRIDGNPIGGGMGITHSEAYRRTDVIDRVRVENVRGIGISYGFQGPVNEYEADIVISNSLISNNDFQPAYYFAATALGVFGTPRQMPVDRHRVRIINCTIADNIYMTGGTTGATVRFGGILTAELYNNLIYGNDKSWILLSGVDGSGEVYMSHNLFENGLDDVTAMSSYSWTADNIISGDPLFNGEGEHPYQLSQRSPAINAGTTDIPGYTFEKYDLAGNQRIVDGRIDLGAYEYQDRVYTSAEDSSEQDAAANEIFSRAFPNPVSISRGAGNINCTVRFSLPATDEVVVSIYNVRGQRVKTLVSGVLGKGDHQVYWDGTNSRGETVGTGMYMYRIETENLEASDRIMIVK